MNKSVLVAGFTTCHVARSAAAAGFDVYAADHFCDADLTACTKDHLAFDELEELPFAAAEMIAKYHPDYVVTTSGAELLDLPNRLGTSPEAAEKFMDKGTTQDFFEKIGARVPRRLNKGEYPAMAKTLAGAGGWRNAIVHSDAELEAWQEFVEYEPYMLQEVISGTPASVCCLVSKNGALALCANEQILRGGEFCPYAFSGSLTPCRHPMTEKMLAAAEKIAAESGCLGTIGIDFVLTDDEAYAIEVNPRFQGTLASIETALGVNLFSLHRDACLGKLPAAAPAAVCTAVRKIMTAPKDMTLKSDLLPLKDFISDIPYPGTSFEQGEVMMSVTGSGDSAEAALASLDKNIRTAVQHIKE